MAGGSGRARGPGVPLGERGKAPRADVDMLSRMRHLVDETIAGLVQPD